MTRKQEKGLVSISLGVVIFLVGVLALVLLRIALFALSVIDAILARIKRWINERFEDLYEGWV